MTAEEAAELARKNAETNQRSEHKYGKAGFVALVWGGEVVTA
ncbi:hypothetical protein ACIRCZ_19355 [Leifsonia sp. NPDC102414]